MKAFSDYSPCGRGAPLLTLACLLLAASPRTFAAAAAAPVVATDPQTILQHAVDDVLAIAYPATPPAAPVDPLVTRLRPVLEKYFSFDLITRSAVGPGWNSFTPADQQRTTTLFTDLVIRTYSDKFEPGDRPKVTYAKPVEIDTTRRELPTTINYAGKNYAVSYRMRQLPAGWRIYDVNIEGVSMVANYRAQFDPLFQKGGAAAIIAALEKNIADFAAKK
jgi:phospholipid transport system substrate-binding protein